ncbi:hypothetical protein GCM10010102_26370 [Promicromonospora citrea]|uniref:Uncharacterized protein n=1 Tax=Promicromonospora citrea TaxID=43677 RepID=A0A8H9GIK9_9MICO|nr:hypothetical protein GCM10010102_26370 [Promicromonospora citrea]
MLRRRADGVATDVVRLLVAVLQQERPSELGLELRVVRGHGQRRAELLFRLAPSAELQQDLATLFCGGSRLVHVPPRAHWSWLGIEHE